MFAVDILCIGKLKEEYLRAACGEYAKRIGGFAKLSVTELPEERLPDKPSEAQIAAALEKEGRAIIEKIPAGRLVVPLCIEGKALSSEELSNTLSRAGVEGKSGVCFIVGGSFGLSDEVKKRGELKLSMSKMTFPHQLARVMLLEQVYRAFQIASGGKYHK